MVHALRSILLLRPRNVRFAYPSRPEEDVFKDFSLRVEPGSTVAIVSTVYRAPGLFKSLWGVPKSFLEGVAGVSRVRVCS